MDGGIRVDWMSQTKRKTHKKGMKEEKKNENY